MLYVTVFHFEYINTTLKEKKKKQEKYLSLKNHDTIPVIAPENSTICDTLQYFNKTLFKQLKYMNQTFLFWNTVYSGNWTFSLEMHKDCVHSSVHSVHITCIGDAAHFMEMH